MVMYLRFAINSHVHNQRHWITPLEPPQNFSSIVYFSKGFWPLSDMLAADAISLRLQGKLSFPYNCQKMNGQIYVLLC